MREARKTHENNRYDEAHDFLSKKLIQKFSHLASYQLDTSFYYIFQQANGKHYPSSFLPVESLAVFAQKSRGHNMAHPEYNSEKSGKQNNLFQVVAHTLSQ